MYQFELQIRDQGTILPRLIWSHFIDYVTAEQPGGWFNPDLVRASLAKFNAVSVPGDFMYFFTEEDRTLFVLKFS